MPEWAYQSGFLAYVCHRDSVLENPNNITFERRWVFAFAVYIVAISRRILVKERFLFHAGVNEIRRHPLPTKHIVINPSKEYILGKPHGSAFIWKNIYMHNIGIPKLYYYIKSQRHNNIILCCRFNIIVQWIK